MSNDTMTPLKNAMRGFNKHVLNPVMLNRAGRKNWYAAVIRHTGRRSGRAGAVAGGSLNDAFIAGVAGGLRRYHDKHGTAVGDLIVTMPISIRTPTDPAVNVTLLSYVDTCAIGINMDAAAIPDAEVFYDCLVAGFDDVVALAN